jgi:HEAT repeat protein
MHNTRLRPLLEAAAERLASANTTELVRLILATEREVALEAIRRAGALKTPAAVQSLSTILSGKDVELRQLAVHAMTEIGSPSALQALERGIEDADREVRISTVRAFTARAYRAALPRVEAAVKGKAIRDADLTEKMAFFEAYGALCGDPGMTFLDSVLNGKGFLGRREDAEIRACAAIALGRLGSVKAIEALRKASTEKDVVVRNAVNRALRGASA